MYLTQIIRVPCRLLSNLTSSKLAPFKQISQRRTFFNFFKKPRIEELKLKDNIPDEYNLIYKSTMNNYLVIAQYVGGISTIAVGFMVLKTLYKPAVLPNQDIPSLYTKARPIDNEVYVYFAVLTGIILVIQLLVSKVPIRIYNYPKRKEYVFVFNGNTPLKSKKVYCKTGEVYPAFHNSFMPWKECNYEIKNKQEIIIVEENFQRPADLYIMMGVQRDKSEAEE
ncbi:unnamed protein product [Brassicogethes aeneus]|uniref:Uncharacterized protein n=1 Tax=Brassicogethes aeneus TaxID=1431903 RepID=A0A9P0AUK4_BRAAE|nr:unnamed protein product [Brassicogethes aeneus]